jgi:hypothetical protein
MKRFIDRLIWKLISAPIVHQIEWTKEERNTFNLFVHSPCGIKLFELLRQTVATKTFNAVCRDHAGANAEARGAQEVLALLHRLRNFPGEPGLSEPYEVDQEPTTPGEPAFDGRAQGYSGGLSAIGR